MQIRSKAGRRKANLIKGKKARIQSSDELAKRKAVDPNKTGNNSNSETKNQTYVRTHQGTRQGQNKETEQMN